MYDYDHSASDTIVAVSTPRGFSGIGVVRMSGPGVLPVLKQIFHARTGRTPTENRRAVYGVVRDPKDGTVLDDGIALYMRGPSTYTGEDIGELSLHGSPQILDAVVRVIVGLGARPAGRGEFTRRAFLAGKLDLVQAEAVIDLIESPTPSAAREARARMDKRLSDRIQAVSNALKDLLSQVEAYIDFDDEDDMSVPRFEESLDSVLGQMQQLIDSGSAGRVLREGLRVVIAGKPNVGKSTLFNALADDDRVIVTPYPGTTRDVVEETVLIDGHRVTLTDTAGIRDCPEPIEAEGIRRARMKMEEADVVIAVLDASGEPDADDRQVLDATKSLTRLPVMSKVDLGRIPGHDDIIGGGETVLYVSGKTGEGLGDLRDALRSLAARASEANVSAKDGCLSRRATLLMETATDPVKRLAAEFARGVPPLPDVISYELRESLRALEEITGERVDEGILERIFERFCVGK